MDYYEEEWVHAMTDKYYRTVLEQPVVWMTEGDRFSAGEYLAKFENKGVSVADTATKLDRSKHAADIRKFLKANHDDPPPWMYRGRAENIQDSLPCDDGAPTSFKEWFAVYAVWRMTRALKEVSFQVAAYGRFDCLINSLPKPFEDKLDECLRITDASAIIPAPNGHGLPITRKAINSVLITSDDDTSVPGFVSNDVIDRWFHILVSERNRHKPGSTVFIHPQSLELVGTTHQKVAENRALIDRDVDTVLFPTMFPGGDEEHCVLLVAFPKRRTIGIYDPRGSGSAKRLRENHSWVEKAQPGESALIAPWVIRLMEMDNPMQLEDDACGVFMLINALCLCLAKTPYHTYNQDDVMFLRRYIAAVICMGELPEPVLKEG